MTKAEFIDLTAHKVLIADDGGTNAIFIPFSQRGYEITSDDVEILTSNTGAKEMGSEPLPSILAYADVSVCDYMAMRGMHGKEYDDIIVTKDMVLIGTELTAGTITGLRAKAYFKTGILPSVSDRNKQFPIYLFFQAMDDFETMYAFKANFKLKELKDSVPNGTTISLDTAYTGGNVILKSVLRCTETVYNGFDATSNWTIIESNANDTAVTVVATAAGLNTLTIKKNNSTTPANLAATDYVKLQATETDGTYYTYVSNELKVYGGT